MKKYLILLTLSLLLISCSDDEAPCSNPNNIDDPSCATVLPDITAREASLNIFYNNSYYYDSITEDWVTLESDDLTGGLFGTTVPIYSSFLNMSLDDALEKVSQAREQFENQNSFLVEEYNRIPYVALEAEPGAIYEYNYIKKNLEGDTVATAVGTLLVKDGFAYLPLINKMFNNQFFSESETVGSRFIHSLNIAARSNERQGTRIVRIEFEALLQSPAIDYSIGYSEDILNYNLKNRHQYYFNESDGVPNQDFNFFTLTEKGQPESVPVDLRVLFKERPTITITQEVFFENPFNLALYRSTRETEVIRGESFYVNKFELDSNNHFKMKIKMNNQTQTLTNDREFIFENFPANVPWNLDFVIDFTQSDAYNDPQGQPLITPYKPTCDEIYGNNFLPLQAEQELQTAEETEGFLSLCHPDLNQKLFLGPSSLQNTQIDLTDTFFKFFNYIPQSLVKQESGHFNGIRSIKFQVEGCIRIFVKTPTASSFELKTVSNTACIEEGETNADGWVYFNAEKTFTINDHIEEYGAVPNLKAIIQSFGAKPILKTPHFRFNGLLNSTNHIY